VAGAGSAAPLSAPAVTLLVGRRNRVVSSQNGESGAEEVDAVNANWESMRAADADRERATDIVKAAFAEGRLDQAEHRRRLDAILSARTYGELHRQVHDLPMGPVPPHVRLPAPVEPGQINPWARYAPVPRRRTEPLAIASLVLAGMVPFTFGLTSVPAVITGQLALARIRRSGEEGRGIATAGIVVGSVVIAFGVLLVLFVTLGILLS
jgi:uncharacterized protein DUF1707/uncharacterized protein DUF4190